MQGDLGQFPPDSEEQQKQVLAVADQDAFNWGYDPVHYSTPEGSFSSNPNGTARIVEFRRMVQALHKMGLRVVLDVVYNHTFHSGMDGALSALDREGVSIVTAGKLHCMWSQSRGDVETGVKASEQCSRQWIFRSCHGCCTSRVWELKEQGCLQSQGSQLL